MGNIPAWALKEREKIESNNILIHIVVPSVVDTDEPFDLRLSAVCADQMPTERIIHLRFLESHLWSGLPEKVELGGEPVRISGLRLHEPGVHRLSASFGSRSQHTITSNPILVDENPKERIFFGDLHIHSFDGLCQDYVAKPPRFVFDYIRSVTFLDFAAITDHVRGLDGQKWESQKRLVAEYDRPGEFVPFLGFESSHRSGMGGDNNAYYFGFQGEYFWLEQDDMKGNQPNVPLTDLWGFLDDKGMDFMTAPHHTGRYKKNRSWRGPWYRPEHEWLFEIYSTWGSSEQRHSRYPLHGMNTENPAYFRDAIAAGCRLGVIASSDDHTSQPGSETQLGPPGYYHQDWHRQKGLAAVFASRLDRQSLWDAFRNRRTYASTFDRSILFFKAEGLIGGSVIDVTPSFARKRHLSIRFIPCAPWAGNGIVVTLVRNGKDHHIWDPIYKNDQIELEYTDDEPFENAAIFDAPHCPDPFIAYYVRIDYMYGGTVWSSPIWYRKD